MRNPDLFRQTIAIAKKPGGYRKFQFEIRPKQRVTGTVQLRAEWDGNEGGRIYSFVCNVGDFSGNTNTASCVVIVPHDRGHGKTNSYDTGSGSLAFGSLLTTGNRVVWEASVHLRF
jgi:hypothetical protein